MEYKTCEYCGTEFGTELTHCPLCNRAVQGAGKGTASAKPAIQFKSTGGRFQAKGKPEKQKRSAVQTEQLDHANEYRLPKGVMIAICIVLALAVIFGALFAFYNIGYFGEPVSMLALFNIKQTPDLPTDEPATAPDAQKPVTEEQYVNEEDYNPEQPEEETPAFVTCTAVSLSTPSITFDEAEQFYNITVSVEPEGCSEEVYFTSSDESVVMVNSNGKIVAISGGTAEITATCGDQTATCLVTCDFITAAGEQDEESLPPELNNLDMTFFSPGEQFSLVVKNVSDDTEITYSSTNENIASVSSTGIITAKGSGDATITASFTHDGTPMSLSCIVRCNLDGSAETAETPAEANCTISHSDVTMSILGEYFKIALYNENEKKISDIIWKSSDTSVCTVDDSGKIYCAGNGTASVSTVYGGVTYRCIVRCNIK